MPYFEVKGFGKESNRKRTKRYKAKDEDHARTLAEKDGTSVETITLERPSPATERQISYAKDLNLIFPSDINVEEMSHLISKKVEEEKDAPQWLQEYALNLYPEENGLAITKYVGLKRLIGFLIYKFTEEKNFVELIIILVYSLINNETKSNWRIPFSNLANHNEVQSIAEILVNDKQVVASIKRYNSEDFVSFGEYTDKEGFINYGGSKRTNAYQITKKLLIEKDLLPVSNYSSANNTSVQNNIATVNNISYSNKKVSSKNKGCLGSLIISLIITSIVVCCAL